MDDLGLGIRAAAMPEASTAGLLIQQALLVIALKRKVRSAFLAARTVFRWSASLILNAKVNN